MTALRLPGIHVGHVHLDERQPDTGQRIADRKTRVAVRARIQDHAVGTAAKGVDRVDELSLPVPLGERQRDAKLAGDRPQTALDTG